MSGRLFGNRHPDSVEDMEEELEEEEEEVEEEGEEGGGSTLPGMNVNWRRHSLPSDRLHSCVTSHTSSAQTEQGSQHGMASGQWRRKSTQLDTAHPHNKPPSAWQSFKKAGMELNEDTRKMFRYFGRKLHTRHGPRQTKVKEIHIAPGGPEDLTWATRMAGSGTSRSSSGSDPSA